MRLAAGQRARETSIVKSCLRYMEDLYLRIVFVPSTPFLFHKVSFNRFDTHYVEQQSPLLKPTSVEQLLRNSIGHFSSSANTSFF